MVEAASDTPSEVLVADALGRDHESDEYWSAVHELQRRGDRHTFELAAQLATSADEAKVVLGLDVLAQLGFAEGRPFLEESLPIVLARAVDPDGETQAIVAAISALGHLGDARGLDAAVGRVRHPDDDVRFAVARALPSLAGEPPAAEAVDALIALTSDAHSDVRDWATFGLGSQLEVDSPRIRDALAARLDDADGDTAGEALVGLARRHNARVVDRLRQWLDEPICGNLIVEAAAAFGSADLLPALLRLKELGWDQDDPRAEWLDQAIEACSGEA